MKEAYTVSRMLNSINEVMAPVATDACASVSLKRRMDNGIMLDTSEKEIAYLDMKSKIKYAAQNVASLDRGKRLEWITEQRTIAKQAFDCQEYQRAAEMYIQTLTALDFGTTLEEKQETQQKVQVPLTCNLAACMLMLEEWEKAKRICDQTLSIDPECARALQQRAKALTRLHAFDEARNDLERAKRSVVSCEGGAAASYAIHIEKQFADIARAELRSKYAVRKQRAFHRKMMALAVGKLYAEKDDVPATSVAYGLVIASWQQRIASLVKKASRAVCAFAWSITRIVSSTKHIKTE